MIIEGLITTVCSEGGANVAPLGPIVEGDFESVLLRPWRGSTTYRNLCSCDSAVFHVVDEVDLIVEAVMKRPSTSSPMEKASHVDNGWVLKDCCRWFELQIIDRDLTFDRAEIRAQVVYSGQRRPFNGFNRARHAILEAAILATRVEFLARDEVDLQFGFFQSAVEKTGTERHHQLFQMLCDFVAEQYDRKASCNAG